MTVIVNAKPGVYFGLLAGCLVTTIIGTGAVRSAYNNAFDAAAQPFTNFSTSLVDLKSAVTNGFSNQLAAANLDPSTLNAKNLEFSLQLARQDPTAEKSTNLFAAAGNFQVNVKEISSKDLQEMFKDNPAVWQQFEKINQTISKHIDAKTVVMPPSSLEQMIAAKRIR